MTNQQFEIFAIVFYIMFFFLIGITFLQHNIKIKRERKKEIQRLNKLRENIMSKQQERDIVFAKYNGRCAYCGEPIKRNAFEVDHVKPTLRGDKDLGGDDSIENKIAIIESVKEAEFFALPKKPIFINSLNEEFFDGDEFCIVFKDCCQFSTLYMSKNINTARLVDNSAHTEAMTRESAEKWIEENKPKVELVRGEVFCINALIQDKPLIFRATMKVDSDGDTCYFSAITSGGIFHLNTAFRDSHFTEKRLATKEEKAQLTKAEKDNGYEWNGKDLVKIEKLVVLEHGKCYTHTIDGAVIRVSEDVEENKEAFFVSNLLDDSLILATRGEYHGHNKVGLFRVSTEAEEKGLVIEERNRGKIWSEKKGDWLTLEDVYCENLNSKDKLDVYSVNKDLLADTCTFVKSYSTVYFIKERKQLGDCLCLNDNSRVAVSKETFIILLKNWKCK